MGGVGESLRARVLAATRQDVRRCGRCAYCARYVEPGEDLSLEGLLQLVVMDDDEALTSRTLWSETALRTARERCIGAIDLELVLLELRQEARRRGLVPA